MIANVVLVVLAVSFCYVPAFIHCKPLEVSSTGPDQPGGCRWQVSGCFFDLEDGRELLSGENTTQYTATDCNRWCGQRGYKVAAMYNAIICRCGHYLNKPPTPSNCCPNFCPQNPSENCGGTCYSLTVGGVEGPWQCSLSISKCV